MNLDLDLPLQVQVHNDRHYLALADPAFGKGGAQKFLPIPQAKGANIGQGPGLALGPCKLLQGCHGTGKTGNLKVHFSRQGKHREFANKY